MALLGNLLALLGWLSRHGATTGMIVAASIVTGLLSAALSFWVVARMSPDYFSSRTPSAGSWRHRHPVIRVLGRLVKNVLGLFFVLIGLAMLVLPGQGLLTVLVGVLLLDFPGKRWLELRLMRRRPVRVAINWIRARAGRPPLLLPWDDRPAAGRVVPGGEERR